MLDQFGIQMICPSKDGGRMWASNWNTRRAWQATGLEIRSEDPLDSQCFLQCSPSYKTYDDASPPAMTAEFPNKVNIDGTGTMTVQGPFPRLFINSNND